jgi:hypothetical protein
MQMSTSNNQNLKYYKLFPSNQKVFAIFFDVFLFADQKINDHNGIRKEKSQVSRGESSYKDNNNNSLLSKE